MGSEAVGYAVRGGTSRTGVSFDFSAFDSLPDAKTSRKYRFTKEQDAALLKYWPMKKHEDVAQLLGVATQTALRRYRELTKE